MILEVEMKDTIYKLCLKGFCDVRCDIGGRLERSELSIRSKK